MRAAVQQRWTLTDRMEGPRPSLILLCPADRTVCAYYDDNGYVSGLQVAVRIAIYLVKDSLKLFKFFV